MEVEVTRAAPHHLEGTMIELLEKTRTPRRLDLRAV